VIERESFWAHVHAALDARRDPLEVPEVQRALAEEPKLLGELAALRSGLELFSRSKRRRVRSLVAATALVVCAAGLAAWRAAQAEPRAHELSIEGQTIAAAAAPAAIVEAVSPLPPQDASGSRVIAFRAEVTLEGPHGRLTRSTDALGSVLASASGRSERDAPFQVQTLVAVTSPASQSR
jgi:hypothetical protein